MNTLYAKSYYSGANHVQPRPQRAAKTKTVSTAMTAVTATVTIEHTHPHTHDSTAGQQQALVELRHGSETLLAGRTQSFRRIDVSTYRSIPDIGLG